jgi:hypothetical protein
VGGGVGRVDVEHGRVLCGVWQEAARGPRVELRMSVSRRGQRWAWLRMKG